MFYCLISVSGITNSFAQWRMTEISFFMFSFWAERSAESFTKLPGSPSKRLKEENTKHC